MLWVFILIVLVVILIVSLRGRKAIPWSQKLKRLHPGSAQKAEWMAPNDVVRQVSADYLDGMAWLRESVLLRPVQQMADSPLHLTGNYLERYQSLVQHSTIAKAPRLMGVLYAEHMVEVRQFSEDGLRCLVIDLQRSRRMMTYDCERREVLHVQDLDEGAVVHQMVYDDRSLRWKIERFIQELPSGWGQNAFPDCVRLASHLPTSIGRDH